MISTFQDIIYELNNFWSKQGCMLVYPYGVEVGAGTSNPMTLLKVFLEKKWNVVYVEPSRRPDDGRYGESDYRFQHYFQYQVILKPIPENNIDIFLRGLQTVGIEPTKHDIRFVEDNWESPSLGASGLGWEVWCDGSEIAQYTYFQQVGGKKLKIPALEITYGLERIALFIQNITSSWDILWNKDHKYGDFYKLLDNHYSKYNFEVSNTESLKKMYKLYEEEALNAIKNNLSLVAYDYVLKMSHTFNMLDAKGVIGPVERYKSFSKMKSIVEQVLNQLSANIKN